MFEKVNPNHPDKIADRIAGAIVDLAYTLEENPKIAVECLIGHKNCSIIIESSTNLNEKFISNIVYRILETKDISIDYFYAKQDKHLALNQKGRVACGDNGIFRGMPVTDEQKELTDFVKARYKTLKKDGKYVFDKKNKIFIACQSNISEKEMNDFILDYYGDYLNGTIVNPLGYWTGGIDVDTGAVNRKLGSDMGDSVTGGGLHGKDLSKADVSINIYAFIKAQETGKPVELYCAIGDEYIDDKPYSEIVEIAKNYINSIGGFEKFAEWGLIR